MKSGTTKITVENNIHWEQFYTKNINLDESTFCTTIKEKFTNDFLIVDIGCGNGRDSFSFAEAGFDVHAVDRSNEAIKSNKKFAEEHFKKDNLRFECIDLSSEIELKALTQTIIGKSCSNQKKVILYLRFLLHAINRDTQNIFFDLVLDELPRGSIFVAEFRTIEDEHRTKIYDDHYRRFIDSDQFVGEISAKGFTVTEFYKGTGLSKFKEEDPFLARIIAEKNIINAKVDGEETSCNSLLK